MLYVVGQEAVGGPPRISVGEENDQVIAVRIHGGDNEYEEDEDEE